MKLIRSCNFVFLFFTLFLTTGIFANDPTETDPASDITAVMYLIRGSDNTSSAKLPAELNGVAAELSRMTGLKGLTLEDTLLARMNPSGTLISKGFTPAFQNRLTENDPVSFEWTIVGASEAADGDSQLFLRQFIFKVNVPFRQRMKTPDGREITTPVNYNRAEITTNNLTIENGKPTLIGKLTTDLENSEPYFVVVILKKVAGQ